MQPWFQGAWSPMLVANNENFQWCLTIDVLVDAQFRYLETLFSKLLILNRLCVSICDVDNKASKSCSVYLGLHIGYGRIGLWLPQAIRSGLHPAALGQCFGRVNVPPIGTLAFEQMMHVTWLKDGDDDKPAAGFQYSVCLMQDLVLVWSRT